LIDEISKMFYQSLLCPDNSVYDEDCAPGGTATKCVNTACSCVTGYIVDGGYCRLAAQVNCTKSGGKWIDSACECPDTMVLDGENCELKESTEGTDTEQGVGS